MKFQSIVLVVLAVGFTVPAAAQQQNTTLPFGPVQASVMTVKAGPSALAGGAVNAGGVSNGSKTSPGFAYMAGALLDFTYTKNVGFDLSLGYDARTINFHDQANAGNAIDYHFGYISLRPELRFDGLMLGVGLGMPVSVGTSASGNSLAPAVRTSDVNALFEGHIGGMVEVTSNDVGSLDLLVDGSYGFTRNLTNSWFHGSDNSRNNGPLATAELGVCYLFDVYHTAPAPPPVAAQVNASGSK